MRVLVSGFEAFDGRNLNPTQRLIEAIERQEIIHPEEIELKGILLPVRFLDSYDILKKQVDLFNPDVILSFGLAAGRSAIELEEVALNLINSTTPDNNGVIITNSPITLNGAESYQSTLPILGIEGKLKEAGLPAKISKSAGTFVCNYLFYKMMEDNQDTQRLCGFIHVPLIKEQAEDNSPILEFDDLKKGITAILTYITY
jgi:pyroglutamyl-peptidase